MPIDTPIDIKLLEEPFVAITALGEFGQAFATSGAIASFTGTVRSTGGVEELELTDYCPLTRTSMLDFAVEAWKRFPLDGLLIWHRKGVLYPNEPIVLVAVAARHRREAFDAVEFLIDHLKSAAWFWKRERRADGWHWIHPTVDDRKLLERWQS